MRVRDAVEADGAALGELADAPPEVMRNVVHDRTVRVAETARSATEIAGDATGTAGDTAETVGNATETADSGDGEDDPEIVGFVGFDATPGTVRVTYLRGSRAARERLLDEPVRFARKEGMDVEVLVPEAETTTAEIVEDAGFQRVGTGPRFDGDRTLEYRLDPARS